VKVVIVGATKGMGRALLRQLAERGEDLFILGIDEAELERSARDAEQRGGGKKRIGTALCDMERPEEFSAALDAADLALGGFDTVIITAALFGTQERLEEDTEFARRLLTVNFSNTVVLCEHVRKRLLARGGGTLCVFSSVAGERGRKPVVLYGASKAGLSAYLEGLDHKFRAQGLRTVTIKPGFVKTGMTEGLKPPPFAGTPEGVAKDVIRAIDRGTPVKYTPSPWALVMLIIRHLPRFVMRKIGF
jgi:short-subunit dehydrogenase